MGVKGFSFVLVEEREWCGLYEGHSFSFVEREMGPLVQSGLSRHR